MTPLETQLLAALRLRRATSHPHTPPPVGLGLPYETEHTTYDAQTRRNIAADAAVEEAIAAGEAAEVAARACGGAILRRVCASYAEAEAAGWVAHTGSASPVAPSQCVDVRLVDGTELGGRFAVQFNWGHPHGGGRRIAHWRLAV